MCGAPTGSRTGDPLVQNPLFCGKEMCHLGPALSFLALELQSRGPGHRRVSRPSSGPEPPPTHSNASQWVTWRMQAPSHRLRKLIPPTSLPRLECQARPGEQGRPARATTASSHSPPPTLVAVCSHRRKRLENLHTSHSGGRWATDHISSDENTVVPPGAGGPRGALWAPAGAGAEADAGSGLEERTADVSELLEDRERGRPAGLGRRRPPVGAGLLCGAPVQGRGACGPRLRC